MSSYSSSSFSGTSSPLSSSFVPRTERRDRSAPRSPRAGSSNQHSSRAFDLGEDSPRRHGASKPGLTPILTARTSTQRPSPRTQRPPSDASRLSPRPRAQNSSHDKSARPPRRFAPGQHIQVPHASPLPSVLPLPLHSLPAPSTPPQRPCEPDELSSPRSVHFALDHARVHFPASGLSTPLPSPRSQRQPRSTSSTPSRKPPASFPIRRALVPAPTPPTLAMSMTIHAPTPIISSRPTSSPTNNRVLSGSRSRPTSPMSTSTQMPHTRPPMPRPPSRSEKLLRDTLRRADEHERMLALSALPSPSLFGATQPAHGFVTSSPREGRRARTNTSSSTGTDVSLDAFAYCDSGVCYSDDEDDEVELWRSPSGSSSSSSQGHQVYFHRPQQPLPRHHSDVQDVQGPWRSPRPSDAFLPDQQAYDSPSSPSPTRAQLRRSAQSAPSVSRSSMSQQHASPHAFNTHNSSRSPVDAERSPRGDQLAATPHDAVLRSRLEGVLRGAKREHERTRSQERDYTSGSNSMASSRNMSGEDWLFGNESIMSSPEESEPAFASRRTRAHTSAASPNARSHRSPSMSTRPLRSPGSAGVPLPPVYARLATPNGIGPLTPPPTPPFNALTAAQQCKTMDGYVSFADIEGLGLPPGEGEDEDDGDDSKRARAASWLKWFGAKAGRDRSDSACSVASR